MPWWPIYVSQRIQKNANMYLSQDLKFFLLLLLIVIFRAIMHCNSFLITGIKMPWNNGAWWPIYVPEWWSPTVSYHPLDPYSFVHLQFGVIFFQICGYPLYYFFGGTPDFKSWPLRVGFTILLALSFIFEIIENSQWMIQQYRISSGTSSDYNGDSY